ncbi:MAG: hypothetical protein U0169_27395 [Polyangiaceae bacterium]
MIFRSSALLLALFATGCSSSSGDADKPDASTSSDGGTSSSDGATTSTGDAAPSKVTVTTITPDAKIEPAYVGVLKSGNLILTEGQKLKADEMETGGKVTHVNSTDFTGFEWPRAIAVDDTGQVYIAGYQTIHSFAKGPSDPRKSWSTATAAKATYEWVTYGGNPKKVWALTGTSPTSPKMQFVRFDAATADAAGTATVVYDVDRFAVMSFVVDGQNNVFTVDTNSCRIRKISAGGTVAVIAGKPGTAGGSCNIGAAYGKDSDGNVSLPQAGALGWDPTGTRLLLAGAGQLADVTEGSDGKSKAQVLHTFEDGVTPDAIATSADAVYVVDRAHGNVRKVVF